MIFVIIGDLTGYGIIAQAIHCDRWVDNVPGQTFSRLMLVGRDAFPLKYGEPWVTPGKEDVDQPLADLLLCQQEFQELMAKQKHELDGIEKWSGEEGAVRQNGPIPYLAVEMRMKPRGVIAVRLKRCHHTRECWGVAGGIVKELLDGLRGDLPRASLACSASGGINSFLGPAAWPTSMDTACPARGSARVRSWTAPIIVVASTQTTPLFIENLLEW